MSLFTIKHVHEGTVEIEVEHKYSGEKVIVDNNRVPEHTREESVKKNDGSIDSRIGDIYLGLGVSILLGLYLEETIGGDVCGKIITGILGALLVFLAFGYTTKLGKKIVKCLKCIFLLEHRGTGTLCGSFSETVKYSIEAHRGTGTLCDRF